MAKNNASVYEVERYIDFILCDALRMGRVIRCGSLFDVAFASPPWGGPDYLKEVRFDPEQMLPVDCVQMVRTMGELVSGHHVRGEDKPRAAALGPSRTATSVYYMPRNTDLVAFVRLLQSTLKLPRSTRLEIEHHYLDDRLKVIIIYLMMEGGGSLE